MNFGGRSEVDVLLMNEVLKKKQTNKAKKMESLCSNFSQKRKET